MQQLVSVVIHDSGAVDVQVFPSSLSLEDYGKVVGTVVRILTNGDREAIAALLKEANRASYAPTPLNVHTLN